MDVYPFKTLYIADLNAIQSIESSGTLHIKIIEEIKSHFPGLSLWTDASINTVEKAKQWTALGAQVILGSESFQTIEQYNVVANQLNAQFALSLDFLMQGYTGPDDLLAKSNHWPKEVIIMTLAKVGADNGVDINTIKHIMQNNQQRDFYAAGGVRHLDDLLQLSALKIKGALIASALHNQSISSQALERLSTL